MMLYEESFGHENAALKMIKEDRDGRNV